MTNTTPVFYYKRRLLTRYVLVIEDTRDMLIRESWTFLRSAIRKWVGQDLPANTEVGVVLSNNTTGHRLLPLSPLNIHARSQVSGIIPFTPGDSHTEACLRCGIRQALDVSNSTVQHRDQQMHSIKYSKIQIIKYKFVSFKSYMFRHQSAFFREYTKPKEHESNIPIYMDWHPFFIILKTLLPV